MITGITLENFKCFRKVEIHPKRVTCFVGPNGTGKSSVLQAFGLLKQTLPIVSYPDDSNNVDSGFDLGLQGPILNVTEPEDLSHNFELITPRIFFEGKHNLVGNIVSYYFSAEISYDGYAVVDLQDGISHVNARRTLRTMKLVPAIRGLTRPVYRLGDHIAFDVAMQEGFTQQENQTATNLGYSSSEIQRISSMIKRITGVGLRVDTVPPQSVEVKSTTPLRAFNMTAEGFGTNSLILLLLQLVSTENGATVMIEEPEIHLHPKAQAELASVLAEVALEEDKQVIMTTHSEHITGRLLTLVAEGTLTPDDVAIYAFEKDEEGGCTAKDLRITPDGTIEGGINDFFETNLEEMNRFVQAQFKRVQPTE